MATKLRHRQILDNLELCGNEVPSDGRPVEYRWCPLLNAGEIFAVVVIVVQFRGTKKTVRRSRQLQGRRVRNLAVNS